MTAGDDCRGATAPHEQPLLVLVSGAPATGKTTLAHRLSEALPLPLLARDAIGEILADAFDVQSREHGQALMQPTFAIYYAVLDQLLRAGISVITESNFHRDIAERDLRPCVARARTVLIHCQTARDVSIRRFIERFERGERHRAALAGDEERIARLRAGELPDSWERAEPVAIDVPTLRVDTTSGYAPDFDAIVSFVRSVGRPAG
ncbi:MAG: ATP-binding protein [Chloroflexota bacterium]|nr:ATP-binding protein [Chloroflexota bacterium]